MTQFTAKQAAFIVAKAAGVANRDAAIAAGYAVSSAAVSADKLMRNPAIRKAIKEATPEPAPGSAARTVGIPEMPRARYDDAMQFLVDVMNHTGLPIAVRGDAAKQLLPYQHARIGEKGKKEKAKERASELANGGGKFTPKKPPQLHVVPKD